MKGNDMLEQMFSAVAQLLGQREEAMLARIAALEKKVEELEQKLQEGAQADATVAAAVAGIVEGAAGEGAVESDVALEDDNIEEEVIAGGDIGEPLADVDIQDEFLSDEDMEDEVLEDEDTEDEVLADEVEGTDGEVVEAVDFDGDEEVLEVEEIEVEEVVLEVDGDEEGDEEPAAEPEMEIELEFFDEDEDIVIEEVEVQESDDVAVVEDNVGDEEDGWAEEYNEGDVEDDGPVLVVDKARPDWYDWEVDIPGSYIEDIWDGIGLNDRLLFLKELFNGDEIDFSDTLDALNEMTTLVEVTEYIRGRYPFWNEESDEVYRFYMTVRRRFNKQRQEI